MNKPSFIEHPWEKRGVIAPGLPILPHGVERHPVPGGGSRAVPIYKGDEISILDKEGLQRHAHEVGNYLKTALVELQNKYPIIGDVRGQGLFLGFRLNYGLSDVTNQSQDVDYQQLEDSARVILRDDFDRNVSIQTSIGFSF